MPSSIALIIYSAFVFYLLWHERKLSVDVSRAFWLPTIWMLYSASKPLAIWFPASGATADTSPLDRLFLMILMCVSLLLLSRRKFDWLKAIRENIWLMLLLISMLVSILWSNIPSITFTRWVKEFQAVIMALIVVSEDSPRQAMESILRRTAYILIPFSLLLIKYFPEYGVEYNHWTGARLWIGVTVHKNSLGRLCIIVAFFLIWSLVRIWKGNKAPVWKYQAYAEIFILILALWLMRGPGGEVYSATAIYALIAALMFCLGLIIINRKGIKIGSRALTVFIGIIIAFGITSIFTRGTFLGLFASSSGRDATLTGRTAAWAQLLPAAMHRPILGYGFGGFWTPRLKAEILSEGHSGYLDVLLGLGFFGIILVSLFLFSSCQKAHRALSQDFAWGVLWIGYLVMATVHNITETSLDTMTSHLTAVILFFSVSYKNLNIRTHNNRDR